MKNNSSDSNSRNIPFKKREAEVTNEPTLNKLTVHDMESIGINYDEAIKTLADLKDSEIFDNSGPDHGTIVMSNIFRTATDHIRIFAGNLNGMVSKDEYLKELENYLSKGNKLSLILEKTPYRDSKKTTAIDIIEKYQKKFPNKISITCLNKNNPFLNLGIHFTVGDDRMYRFETDVTKFTARCSFNDSAFAINLLKIFDTLEASGKRFSA